MGHKENDCCSATNKKGKWRCPLLFEGGDEDVEDSSEGERTHRDRPDRPDRRPFAAAPAGLQERVADGWPQAGGNNGSEDGDQTFGIVPKSAVHVEVIGPEDGIVNGVGSVAGGA